MNPPAGRKRARVESHDRGQPTRLDASSSHDGTVWLSEPQSSSVLKSLPSPEQASDPYAYALPPQQAAAPASVSAPKASASSSSSSAFRNVSACNRCRLRKNRCDQNLPSCSACEKAGAKCVGFDPITKREIPRSYVYFLESRTSYLESLLQEHGIPYTPQDSFVLDGQSAPAPHAGLDGEQQVRNHSLSRSNTGQTHDDAMAVAKDEEDRHIDKLVSNIGLVSVQGASAVKSTVSSRSRTTSEPGGRRTSLRTAPTNAVAAGGTSMRDSFFGLHTKPTIQEASFPDRELGLKLVNLYFEHANPQIPILHRGEFMTLFDRVYTPDHKRTSRESYLLNIVFAIGAGIILTSSDRRKDSDSTENSAESVGDSATQNKQYQPEEYHASAIVHLEGFLGSTQGGDRGFGGGLEELQAVLLLAGFALLRPVAPGLWYIIGVAVRLGVDLGLHYEDGVAIEGQEGTKKGSGVDVPSTQGQVNATSERELRRREWVRDLRRRLWWCCYSFDRLVSTCVGRPFGITDQVVTTEFPSTLDDKFISPEGFDSAAGIEAPSYKFVAHHYFQLRLLQSEILQVLQHQQAQRARAITKVASNPYMHTHLPSPFLVKHRSFRDWRSDIDRRLWEWKQSAPTKQDTGVAFQPLFLELNYWQAVIMLYRQSLTTPLALAEEIASVGGDVSSPVSTHVEEQGDEEFVFLKIAEAGQRVLKIYRQLHRVHLVNYTFLATHHLFMAGISFLYAIWHSATVRSHLTLDDVDFTVLAAVSVLDDLIEKCPPAEACRDSFSRMSKATIQMCMSTTGFGPDAIKSSSSKSRHQNAAATAASPATSRQAEQPKVDVYKSAGTDSRPAPRFDMNLRDLFSEEDIARPFGHLDMANFARRRSLAQTRGTLGGGIGSQRQDTNTAEAELIDPSLRQASFERPGGPAPAGEDLSAFMDMDDMDFLDDFAMGNAGYGGNNDTANEGALDLFGIGAMDGTHDWSDGNGVDLFEGFFFGNTGNGQPPSS
ncbi:hypothetical protein FH972_023637 [Carpinus fangiana]|uniref:Zn(2)-C6 fungal-type domain-containing protein n=1 Tax=Carpinus fangiana TaxID=176857 RepID=A0A5N6KW10_9ROSI|nr:hypothetical protein FH972_023637 [Carpinus fangiana]